MSGGPFDRPAPRSPDADPEKPPFLRRRRAEALAALVPLVGLFLLMPPFVRIFAHDGRILGAPSALIFLLVVWIGLILGTRRLARRLVRRDPEV